MSETAKRISSGLTLGAIVIVALVTPDFMHSLGVLLLVVVFSLLGVVEFYTLTDKGLEGKAMKGVGVLFSLIFVGLYYIQYLSIRALQGHVPPSFITPDAAYVSGHVLILVFMLFMIVTMSTHLILRPLDGTIYGVAVTLFGVLYTVIPLCHVFLLLGQEKGVFFFLVTALATIMTDAGAYFAGKYLGKHNAGLKVSPRKTYEGYVGGFVFSIAFNLAFFYFWKKYANAPLNDIHMSYVELAIFTGVISVLSVFGDLVESALKRDARKKDSASLIPGHGGMLDLADALFFSIPVGYYYLYFREMAGYSL
ncbi:MAG: phosphatidate cytidylyltransferase [Leptospirales bacterium]|nr:phosphatidate cytidylyltransferase [Leptospirales bacterium]